MVKAHLVLSHPEPKVTDCTSARMSLWQTQVRGPFQIPHGRERSLLLSGDPQDYLCAVGEKHKPKWSVSISATPAVKGNWKTQKYREILGPETHPLILKSVFTLLNQRDGKRNLPLSLAP